MRKVILLSFRQLTYFGVHVGHDKTNYMFLSSWIFLGWYKNIFIINLYKTYLNLRHAINLFVNVARKRKPLVYVCVRSVFGPLVARYAFICGESFNIYWWIFGSLTNFKKMLGWNRLLVRLMLRNKHKLRFKDKKRLASYFGLVLSRRRIPRAGFVASVLDNLGPVDEFIRAITPCVGIVDSNVPSWNLLLPVPGNDDSLICVNFYCYLLSRAILVGKLRRVLIHDKFVPFKPWRSVRYKKGADFVYLYSNVFRNYEKKKFFELFEKTKEHIVPIKGSIGYYINYWLTESEIVRQFSQARGEAFLTVSEEKPKEHFKMFFSLN